MDYRQPSFTECQQVEMNGDLSTTGTRWKKKNGAKAARRRDIQGELRLTEQVVLTEGRKDKGGKKEALQTRPF